MPQQQPDSFHNLPPSSGPKARRTVELVLKIGAPIFLFLFSIYLVGSSFSLFEGNAEGLLGQSQNPFLAFFIGMLATALIQSSSTTTASIVALVAAGKLGLVAAIPFIMGANIGTAITSTIVALGHIGNTREYSKAISAASLHDIFNVITAVFLFLVEYFFGILSSLSTYLGEAVNTQDTGMLDGLFFYLSDVASYLIGLTGTASYPDGSPWICLPIGLAGLFLSIRFFTYTLKAIFIGKIEKDLNRYFFLYSYQSLFWGFISTAAVQSSSVTTSLIVPLVATGKVSLKRAFPFIMGANIGTTTTAVFAAIFIGSEHTPGASAALAIAFAHLFFNLAGVLLIFPHPKIRQFPVLLAEKLGRLCLRNRLYGVVYIVGFFFVLPGLLIIIFR